MVAELIGKYVWLIQILTAAGERGLLLKEIMDKYERCYNETYSRRSFNNHRAAIEEIFGIRIDCRRSDFSYFIPFGDEAMDEDSSSSWLINTFTVNNLLSLGKERLSGRVSVEDVPSGQKFLTGIMQAMEDNCELEIVYSKYSSDKPSLLHVQPLAVKERERRWYLLAFCRERVTRRSEPENNSDQTAWRLYALDRILTLRETEVKFRMPDGFDVEDFFSRSFGIYRPKKDEKTVLVRIKAYGEEPKYLRDLPLHPSQKEEADSVFTIRVIPSKDLTMELCKRGDRVEVLEPEELREAVAKEHEKAAKLYR